ncbi:MAG: DUF4157 domain-containing protein [Pseudomonadota bacterium]
MEALLDMDLRQVRIHIHPALARAGARAFAYGDSLYFAPGQYQAHSREGWRVLGHELAHVRQQRDGLLGAIPPGMHVVHDAVLEAHADCYGALAAHMFDTGIVPPLENRKRAGGQATPAIQCLMAFPAFKEASSATGFRTSLAAVDTALQEFHELDKPPKAINKDYVALLAKLRTLATECEKFRKAQPTSTRLRGVEQLVRQIGLEEVVLSSLARYKLAADEIGQWEALEETQTRYLKIADRAEFTRKNFSIELDELMLTQGNLLNAAKMSSHVIMGDIKMLKAVAHKEDAPDIIRAVVREITAASNTQQLDMAVFSPGLKYNTKRGILPKYTLNHKLDQSLGVRFRLGSLAHELTHLSNCETFGNSVMMLSIEPSASDAEICNLARQRKANLLNLQATLATIPATEISARLNEEMHSKLGYPISGKLLSYLGSFKRQLDATEDGKAYRLRLEALCRGGKLDCELIEFDSVINQIMLWCYFYKISPDNAFYRQIQTVAQVAYNYRAEHRLVRRRVVSPVGPSGALRTQGRRMSF